MFGIWIMSDDWVGRAWSWMIQVTNQQRGFCEGHGWNHGWALQLTNLQQKDCGYRGTCWTFCGDPFSWIPIPALWPILFAHDFVRNWEHPAKLKSHNYRFGFRRTHISLRLLQPVENPANHATCENWRVIGPWGLWVDRCAATWNLSLSEAVGNQQSSITWSIVVYSQYLLLSVT